MRFGVDKNGVVERTTVVKLGVVAVIAAAVVFTLILGGFDALRDQDRVEEFLTESGPWGPLAFILAFVALQPLSLPGAVLIIPATFVWPWWEVTIYTLAGGLLASTIGFVLARWIAQDWVRARLPDRMRAWESRLAEHGFVSTVLLRVLTGYAPPADWLLGVSRVSVPSFLAGTIVGLIPGTIAIAVWGDDAVRGLADVPPAVLVIAAVAVVGGYLVLKRRRTAPTT